MTEINLVEYKTKEFKIERIPANIGKIIHQNYGKYLDIKEPSLLNDKPWQITPKGYIGTIPITPDFTIRILPKTEIKYVWQMLDFVENLDSLKIFDQLTNCDRLEDICDYLARKLAEKILKRTKQGLYHSYIPENARLIAPRGQIQWHQAARTPWETRLPCRYDTHTADIPENQILLWTIHQLGRTQHLLKDTTKNQLRKAHHALQGTISLTPFTAKDCQNFTYHRLNQDYKIIHQLCKFFLENLTPSHHNGTEKTLPFLINTAVLYEKFVYSWLKQNLKPQYEIKEQQTHRFTDEIEFRIDLVLYDRATQQAIAVLDTKYKTPEKPSQNDLNQIVHYALLKQTQRAILIYPEALPYAVDQLSKNIRVQTIPFVLNEAIATAGEQFLARLLPEHKKSPCEKLQQGDLQI